jgi:alpha-tubulin suppressor-like RCC1 family protein
VDLATGYEMSCGLRPDRSFECWGGLRGPPAKFSGPVTALAAGTYACLTRGCTHGGKQLCVMDEDSIAICWDTAEAGKPGLLTTSLEYGPFTQIATAGAMACGLDAEGTATCWGEGSMSREPPENLVQITVGANVACGLRSDGSVECWPESDAEWELPPQDVAFQQIHCGDNCCGVTNAATIRCWGRKVL